MVEISSGSFAPAQSSIVPATTKVSQPFEDGSDADERAVSKAIESDTDGGSAATEVQPREKAEEQEEAPADEGGDVVDARSDDSGNQVDISV